MKINGLVLLLLICTFRVNAQKTSDIPVEWHSYTQLRAASNFDDYTNFSVRRLKFWIKSKPEFSKHWSFKAQAIFMSLQKEKFFLQDIFVDYRWGNSSIRFGQFIPKFSVQRFQPDYLIPSVERSRPVMFLIPDGTLGVRDIGAQYNLHDNKKRLEFNAGIFNGYGIKYYRFDNQGIMLTHNLSYTFALNKSKLRLGYSVMYRKADELQLLRILPDTVLYSGDEYHWNVYALFTSKVFNFQAEYFQANLSNGIAEGYYGLATIKLNPKNQIFLTYDLYESIYASDLNKPQVNIGYNYLMDDYKMMLTLDTGFREVGGKLSNITVLQFQLFIH